MKQVHTHREGMNGEWRKTNEEEQRKENIHKADKQPRDYRKWLQKKKHIIARTQKRDT